MTHQTLDLRHFVQSNMFFNISTGLDPFTFDTPESLRHTLTKTSSSCGETENAIAVRDVACLENSKEREKKKFAYNKKRNIRTRGNSKQINPIAPKTSDITLVKQAHISCL